MRILVDGYNLAHASGILARNIGPGTLQKARDGLVGFLAASLTEKERPATTLIFDAKDAPPDVPNEHVCEGIRVVYALGYATADALIEELIGQDSVPRQLVVVSSDLRIQRAARRRRATAIGSEQWYADLSRRRRDSLGKKNVSAEKPDAPSSDAEVEYWLKVFGEDAP